MIDEPPCDESEYDRTRTATGLRGQTIRHQTLERMGGVSGLLGRFAVRSPMSFLPDYLGP